MYGFVTRYDWYELQNENPSFYLKKMHEMVFDFQTRCLWIKIKDKSFIKNFIKGKRVKLLLQNPNSDFNIINRYL